MSKISERFKFNNEIADELHINPNDNTQDMKSNACGKLGGKIGGEMVKRMISEYENKYLR